MLSEAGVTPEMVAAVFTGLVAWMEFRANRVSADHETRIRILENRCEKS